MIIITIVMYEMVFKCLERELEIRERFETNQTSVMLSSARLLRRILETTEGLLSHRLKCKDYQLMLVRGARGAMVIAVGNELGDTSSNHGRE